MSIPVSSKTRVDVVREQERRARLQLLDEIREPSPQPIFGEPVKVELEDETSRRIKNTLGDFTQVLINDSKNLLGIQRSSSSTSGPHTGPQSGRAQPAAKRPPVGNGMYKPSPTNIPKHPAPDKRLGYPRSKPHDPLLSCPPSSLQYADSRLKDQTQWENPHLRKSNPAPPLNGNSQCAATNPGYSSVANPSLGPNLLTVMPSLPSNKAYPFHLRNGMVPNATVQAPRYGESSSSAPPPKRSIFRPSNLKLPERKPEKHAESPIELETILREMKQAVPPPLTAIQTPRTEECGFAFPDDPKEEVILSKVKELKLIKSPVFVPQPPEPPKLTESNSRQNTPSPCISSSLQDDLEMSDSDDEAVTQVKSTPADFPKSPVNTASHISNTSSTAVNNSIMDVPQAVPSNSSSSESGDSDSDDSSSDSNDSDSSASSDASDADTPSKMWGLSNFFEETRRNHSPAFVPMDTSTNSSTNAVKEEPPPAPPDVKESYSLVDDDSGHGIIREYALDLNDILNVPIADPIPDFLELDNPVNIKNEILSPITSPLHSSGPPAPLLPPPPPPPPPPPAIRGPRTPPSPSYPVKDESVEAKKNSASSGNVQTEPPQTVELTVPQLQNSRHSGVQQNNCDTQEDLGNVQLTTAKKQPRLSKNKTDTFSPRTESSPVTQASEDDEPSASKGLSDMSLDKDENDVASSLSLSSCSVPSETSESSHENYSIKTRQKISKSSNSRKAKSLSEESLSESGQKENSSKSSTPKFKHPTRTCRASNESKQLSKRGKSSTKSDLQEEVKMPLVKPETKEKSSLEKSKIPLKTVGNTKGVTKNSVKVKKKPTKASPKQVSEGKKGDMKKKKSKFHIENFLQSPTISQSETVSLPKVSSARSPSRDKSPFPEFKYSNDGKRKPSVSPSRASRSPSRSSSKSVERVVLKNTKGGEKLRRSTRCSERASSIGQAESSLVAHQDSDITRRTAKRTPKLRESSSSPVHMVAPPNVAPIPQDSPIPVTFSECAIPNKIMVCIPLDKLSRLPTAAHHALDPENKSVLKSKLPQQSDECVQKKVTVLQKRASKSVLNKSSVLKDIKDKPRTEPNAKSNKTTKSPFGKKDKNVKASNETSIKSKTASSVNSKTSIKAADKQSWESSTAKVSKKRKNEGEDKQLTKKKPKTYPEANQEKMPFTPLRTESPNLPDPTTKSKNLERCDSVSSFSSLCSQTSSKSSKLSREKRSSSALSDSKRGKSSNIPVKHIKQEKEDKIKTTIKKEPGTPDKNKDKTVSKEGDCNQKASEPWSDTSSQCGQWSDQFKEDTKGHLPFSNLNLLECISRVGLDFIGSEITKDLKDASTKDVNSSPIMPVDYYYTEGKKQKHLAEKEKDPLLQTLKYFEATVLFILTSQQQEEYTKEPESVYQFYKETLKFSNVICQNAIQQASPGSTEFKLLILLLRCQALLHVKLYNLKLKEIKEQQKPVSDFFYKHCNSTVRSLARPNHPNSRLSLTNAPSPLSPTPSPAGSVNSQTSGYSSSDVSGIPVRGSLSHLSQSVNVSQSMLEKICRQHTHLFNLHMGHDLWEQADMYMTRSNLREFFKEVADQSENLTLHSSIKDLVNYVQTGISLVKKCSR